MNPRAGLSSVSAPMATPVIPQIDISSMLGPLLAQSDNPAALAGQLALAQAQMLQKQQQASSLGMSSNPAFSGLGAGLAGISGVGADSGLPPSKGFRVYVGSIQYNLTPDHVKSVFKSFGDVLSCGLVHITRNITRKYHPNTLYTSAPAKTRFIRFLL